MFTKKVKEKYDNEIAKLRHEIADLTNIVKTQELVRLRAENARLKEMEQLISKVRFQLKDIGYSEIEGTVLVKYKIPDIKLLVNDEGIVSRNDFFYAVNKLQLLSFDDMKKISAVIDSIKKQK